MANDIVVKIDAAGIPYRDLNASLRDAVSSGAQRIELPNVCGQRYGNMLFRTAATFS